MIYIIVYPCGNTKKLTVAEISEGCEHEISDYSVASRRRFNNEDDANAYAKELARDNGLILALDGPQYLD